mgnify:FL=1
MVEVGETETLPEVRPPVEKFVPVQEVALIDDQLRVDDWPAVIEVGLAEREAVGAPGGETVRV